GRLRRRPARRPGRGGRGQVHRFPAAPALLSRLRNGPPERSSPAALPSGPPETQRRSAPGVGGGPPCWCERAQPFFSSSLGSAGASSSGALSAVSSSAAVSSGSSGEDWGSWAASDSSVLAGAAAGAADVASDFLVERAFGEYSSVTSSITAIGAWSPLRGPIL